MPTISEHVENLHRMVDTDAGKVNVLTQIHFIGNLVAAIETEHYDLVAEHAQLKKEHSELQSAKAAPTTPFESGLLEARDKEIGRLKAEISRLMKENESLRVMEDALRSADIGRNQVPGWFGEAPHQDEEREWPEGAVRVLLDLAEHPQEIITSTLLALNLKMKEPLVQHYLDEMRDYRLVDSWYADDGSTTWKAAREGRALLVKLGKL
jgi:DNA-binding FrmR family transcriptional regulator